MIAYKFYPKKIAIGIIVFLCVVLTTACGNKQLIGDDASRHSTKQLPKEQLTEDNAPHRFDEQLSEDDNNHYFSFMISDERVFIGNNDDEKYIEGKSVSIYFDNDIVDHMYPGDILIFEALLPGSTHEIFVTHMYPSHTKTSNTVEFSVEDSPQNMASYPTMYKFELKDSLTGLELVQLDD